jgi:acyl-CoA oxidase
MMRWLAGLMVGGLTTGRMLIAQAAIDSLKIGCSIAIRYSLQRPQFGNKPIMQYITHQLRLLPALADAYALHLAMTRLKNIAFSAVAGGEEMERAKQVHVMSSGIKAAATWCKVDGLQKCRECCGGQGFLAINKIGPMAVDTNVDATFEGDNTVMMQQVAKSLVEAAMKQGGQVHSAEVASSDVLALGEVTPAATTAVMNLLRFR